MHPTVLLLASWAVYLASFIGMLNAFPCGFGKHLWSVTEEQLQCYMNVRQNNGIHLYPLELISNLFHTSAIFVKVAKTYNLNIETALPRRDLLLAPNASQAVPDSPLPPPQPRHRLSRSPLRHRLCRHDVHSSSKDTIVFTAVLSGPCNPLDVGSSTCLNNVALAQAVLNISTDGVLVLMPVIMLWGLNMPRKQKITVGCILTLGSGYVSPSHLPFPPPHLPPKEDPAVRAWFHPRAQ
ncbi:hypothetical protein diail_1325 [Diaporthe ilicicola]|nr:hypothetical protein diail_1325 [Diaporthe ilicicola]